MWITSWCNAGTATTKNPRCTRGSNMRLTKASGRLQAETPAWKEETKSRKRHHSASNPAVVWKMPAVGVHYLYYGTYFGASCFCRILWVVILQSRTSYSGMTGSDPTWHFPKKMKPPAPNPKFSRPQDPARSLASVTLFL